MRKWILSVAAVVAAVWGLMWIGSAVMEKTLARRDDRVWPLGLSTIHDVPNRYPLQPATPAAMRLSVLARPLEIDLVPRDPSGPPRPVDQRESVVRTEIGDYVRRQVQRANPAIDVPPETVVAFLADRDNEIEAVRALLISGSPLGWAQNIELGAASPIPRLLGHMQLGRLFVASALDRARRGDAGAWHDLQAVWMMNRNLLERPEIISAMIGVANARSVNAAARKMPLPAPEWFREVQRHDYRRAMVAAYQAEAWGISHRIYAETTTDADPDDPAVTALARVRDTVLAPYTRLCASDEVDRWRVTATDIAASTLCDLDPAGIERKRRASIPWWNVPAKAMAAPNLAAVWQRVFRFRAELEATERALDLRVGRPPRQESSCTDGKWIYSAGGMRFSHRFPPPAVGASAIPVEFWLTE